MFVLGMTVRFCVNIFFYKLFGEDVDDPELQRVELAIGLVILFKAFVLLQYLDRLQN